VDTSGADALGSPLSVSARVSSVIPDLTRLSQCVPVTGEDPYELRTLLRSTPSAEAHALTVLFCDYYPDTDCMGSSLGLRSIVSILESTGGVFVEVGGIVEAPAAATSALCGIGVETSRFDSPFDFELDHLFLGSESAGAIFSDGFESGDVSAWSFASP